MIVARTRVELDAALADARDGGARVAFVPTMGNLHAGHLALVEAARALADRVVVSIYVNPLQFGPGEDFAAYPRTFADDHEALLGADVDVLFAPSTDNMYPEGEMAVPRIGVPASIGGILDGAARPGHFDGVATVVARLFETVRPQVAVFGEKDFQQLCVIRWMVDALHLPVEIVGHPTVRATDGLALSSRNQYLTAAERAQAPALYAALREAAQSLSTGESDWAGVTRRGTEALATAGFRPDYFEVRGADDLSAPIAGGRLVILAAARLGKARLIDNLRV